MIGAGSDRVRPYARRLRLFAVDRFETMASDGRKPIDRNTANGAVWRQRESVRESPKRRRLVPYAENPFLGNEMEILAKLKLRASQLKRNIVALWLASRDPRVPPGLPKPSQR